MDPEQEIDVSPPNHNGAPKRTRVLLSCAPCRASKLKCDRASPCSQCLKKGRTDGCVYAPRPQKHKPAKSMAARLKRLEGMVREMIDTEDGTRPAADTDEFVLSRGQVVRGAGANQGTTYVGATHFMAMLDDIEDLKSYFDESDGEEEEFTPDSNPEADSPEMLIMSRTAPKTKQDLLGLLPTKAICDRLVMRYFGSNSPSQHIVHRPTFVRQYKEFWQDPMAMATDWLALLFMVLSLSVFYTSFSAPHELQADSPVPPSDRFRTLRTAAGYALVSSRYTNPGRHTLAPLLLYVEAEFITNRGSQTTCYLLSSICVRMMLKMGLHRDPSKLANITPYEGEMRRRLWNLAIQIDLMVSFHMGLPAMIHGIESDTAPPQNIIDEDFCEDSEELPPPRPKTEFTHMSYSVFKSAISRVFGLVARQAHALTLPTYAEVMKVDELLEERWAAIPPFMKPKSLDESVADPAFQVIQRFGIASLYQKSRCVLHRRYLIETPVNKDHDYSRKACLSAALSLLDYQDSMYQATQPGGLLAANGWFVTSLAMHDFLLAAMIVYLVIQHQHYSENSSDNDWLTEDELLPNKVELVAKIKRSATIWSAIAVDTPEVKKAPEVLQTMLKKIRFKCEAARRACSPRNGTQRTDEEMSGQNGEYPTPPSNGVAPSQSLTMDAIPPAFAGLSFGVASQEAQVAFSRNDLMPSGIAPEAGPVETWIPEIPTNVDWNTIENALRDSSNMDPALSEAWLNTGSYSNLDFVAENFWNPPGMSGQAPPGQL